MKRIILAVVTILASAGLTFAATTAAWTDTATATDIVVQSGSADLRIWNSATNAYIESADSPFSVTDLEPGVEKQGSAFWLKQFVSDPTASGMTLKGKITEFKIFDSTNSAQITDDSVLNALDDDIQIQVYEITGGTGASGYKTLSQWKSISTGYTLNSTLDSAIPREKEYGIKVKFVNDPDNRWQNKTLKFNLEVTGTTISGS